MAHSDSSDAVVVFRFKRLTQVFWALELALVFLFVLQLVYRGYYMATAVLLLGLTLSSVYFLLKRGLIDQAATTLFVILALTVSALMWAFAGLRDETLLAFPVFIIFSAILGNNRLFYVLVAYAIGTVLAIGVANTTGWHVNTTPGSSLRAAIVIAVILVVISYSVWLLSNDLREGMVKLNLENQRVRDSQSRIKQLVHHDVLTNLPNRTLARERFEHALAVSNRNSSMVCLMFLDLDDFKTINDSFGHQSGDELLKETACRLKSIIRQSDSVCRQGGDEFLVILESIDSDEQVASIAIKILEEIKKPISLNDITVVATVSIGIAVAPNDGSDFDTICKEADLAMYHAKDTGRNNYRFFDQAMNRHAQESLRVLADLHEAIDKQQFELYYQPKIDLQTSEVIGAEALIRWNHPTLGLLRPHEFIPLAERSGLIVDIGDWVLREACRERKRWQDEGFSGALTVAVNVSAIQFKRRDMVDLISQSVLQSGILPAHLELELTETLLIDDSELLTDALESLRKLGVELSIDDFGTGYSNLSYLKKFDVGVLKVDRSFVSKVLTSAQDRAIVEAIVHMSCSLKLKTVAEGVESAEVAAALADIGCDMGQGYYWSVPLTAKDFLKYLIRQTSSVRKSGQIGK